MFGSLYPYAYCFSTPLLVSRFPNRCPRPPLGDTIHAFESQVHLATLLFSSRGERVQPFQCGMLSDKSMDDKFRTWTCEGTLKHYWVTPVREIKLSF